MKNLIHIFILSFFPLLVNAQATRFNIQKDFFGNADIPTFCWETNNSFVISGYIKDSLGEDANELLFIDKFGSYQKKILIKKNNPKIQLLQGVANYNDSTILILTSNQYPSSKISGGIAKLKMNGDTLWFKNSFIDTTFNSQVRAIIQVKENEFLITGTSDEFDSSVDVWIMSIDSLGNQNWVKNYSAIGTYESSFQILKLSNSDILISGGTYNFSTEESLAKIIITDSLGNFKRQKLFGTSGLQNGGAFCHQADTNKLIAYYSKGVFDLTGTFPPTDTYTKHTVMVLDTNLNIQNEFPIIDTSNFFHSTGPIIFSNQKYYFIGSFINYITDKISFGMCIYDDSLHFLSSRRYTNFVDIENAVTGSIKTSDNGFLIIGTNYPLTTSQDYRVIKTDSLGCDTIGCEIYDNIQETTIIQQYSSIEVYPNPSNDIVYLKIQRETGFNFSGGLIQLYDNMGKIVLSENVNKNLIGQAHILISNLTNGIYFGKILVNGSSIGNFKVVKQ